MLRTGNLEVRSSFSQHVLGAENMWRQDYGQRSCVRNACSSAKCKDDAGRRGGHLKGRSLMLFLFSSSFPELSSNWPNAILSCEGLWSDYICACIFTVGEKL